MLFSRKQKSERATEHAQVLAALEQAAKNALPKVAVCARRGQCDGCSMGRTCARRISKEGRL